MVFCFLYELTLFTPVLLLVTRSEYKPVDTDDTGDKPVDANDTSPSTTDEEDVSRPARAYAKVATCCDVP